MQIPRTGCIALYAMTFVHLWGRVFASTSPAPLPTPTLKVKVRSIYSVVLVCQAPKGNHGVLFKLFQEREEVDLVNLQYGAEEVQFTVRVDTEKPKIFCCLYKDQQGLYSLISPYLDLDDHNDDAPTVLPSIPPPLLSVDPPTDVVKPGATLRFSCSIPTPQSQSQSQSQKPSSFLLLRTSHPAGSTSVILSPKASRVSDTPLPGHFTVGPVRKGDEGEYTCFYQITKGRGLVNSTASNVIKIIIADKLPTPSLVLQQTDVWHLLCAGSAAYPGATFSLFLADNEAPVATQRTPVTQHQAVFPLPVQDSSVALYECQYSVLLGSMWSNSDRSVAVSVTKGNSPSSSSGVDWPLLLGASSAAVLFLCSLVIIAVVAHRKVKTAAEKKKKRQEAQFWTKVHGRDHVVDLTLRRTSFTYQEWNSGVTETASRSSLWNPLSTFTTEIH
ncbi:uncharacterized protein LOC112157302 isoform X2 [Oryzias melastigma]|uniref:uncharacterized protein LOC112157302 isoform X2 n=1 Tax=Oryzias melastigma TaxID=30732 RepID=UPI000CF8082A|nr:uncharacterized protein LOC112157302 isoform X2 [Oryzias melastigma]